MSRFADQSTDQSTDSGHRVTTSDHTNVRTDSRRLGVSDERDSFPLSNARKSRVKDPVRNFWSKVDTSGECWIWRAACDIDGYGKFAVGLGGRAQKHIRAHRFSFETFVGDIPEGMVVCHRCDNPPCCNPAHLFLGTPKDNNDDKVAKGRHAQVWGTPLRRSRQTRCGRGHEFDEANTYITSRGHRHCRTCSRENARRYYHKTRGTGQ